MKRMRGEELRDEGIERVRRKTHKLWRLRVRKLIEEMASHETPFTADRLHRKALKRGIGEPHHPNAWGAQVMSAARAGLVVKTGVHRKARRAKSHARQYPMWIGASFSEGPCCPHCGERL